MTGQYILDGHTPIVASDLEMWARWYEYATKNDGRRVAETVLPNGVRVSTVFLGIDHNWGDGAPLLFETMIFGGPNDQYQERYSTWEQAEEGHEFAVALAQEA